MSGRLRIKWECDDRQSERGAQVSLAEGQDQQALARDLEVIRKILTDNSLITLFQPIFNAEDGSVLGYEALSRTREKNPFDGMNGLFQRAIQTGCTIALDCACLSTALKTAGSFSLGKRSEYLFLNICPETLMNHLLFHETCDGLIEAFGISHEQIVLEITEESMISNYAFFKQSLEICRCKGYKIAIDDFGAGYGGLKMLSTIEPDFVKIDRHFIADIDRAIIKFNLVDAIATACHRIGIDVIAEGIEREEELAVLHTTGIQYLQGFYLGYPSPYMSTRGNASACCPEAPPDLSSRGEEPSCIGDLSTRMEPIAPEIQVIAALRRFTDNPELRTLPVVDGAVVVGMLHRSSFLEENIISRHGYGYSMNTYKTVADVMERKFFLFEANTTIDDVSRRIQTRKSAFLYDDICVARTGKYHGTVPLSLLLNAIMERNIILAKGSNPLMGLPGNEFIRREITLRLSQNMHFDVSYIDIDNFKPFNDHYGFERGDHVIKSLAAIISRTLSLHTSSSFSFAGHIGGDDFILVTRPQESIKAAQRIITDFQEALPEFHGIDDFNSASYTAKNRRGLEEDFRLLSLSIGIVSTEVHRIDSFPQLASLSTEVKKRAKMEAGSSLIRDRRKMGSAAA